MPPSAFSYSSIYSSVISLPPPPLLPRAWVRKTDADLEAAARAAQAEEDKEVPILPYSSSLLLPFHLLLLLHSSPSPPSPPSSLSSSYPSLLPRYPSYPTPPSSSSHPTIGELQHSTFLYITLIRPPSSTLQCYLT